MYRFTETEQSGGDRPVVKDGLLVVMATGAPLPSQVSGVVHGVKPLPFSGAFLLVCLPFLCEGFNEVRLVLDTHVPAVAAERGRWRSD